MNINRKRFCWISILFITFWVGFDAASAASAVVSRLKSPTPTIVPPANVGGSKYKVGDGFGASECYILDVTMYRFTQTTAQPGPKETMCVATVKSLEKDRVFYLKVLSEPQEKNISLTFCNALVVAASAQLSFAIGGYVVEIITYPNQKRIIVEPSTIFIRAAGEPSIGTSEWEF